MSRDPDQAIVERVSEKLREARIAQGFSQQRLAEEAGISRTGLRHIEAKDASPTLYNVLRLARALQLDIPSLFEES